MKIGVIGATGKQGSLIVKEAVGRGHEVTAIVRNASKVSVENVEILEKDLFDLKAEDLKSFEVVVNAFGAPFGQEHLHVEAGRVLIEAIKGAPDTRLIVVGGAGSLFVDEAKTIRLKIHLSSLKRSIQLLLIKDKIYRIFKIQRGLNGLS